MSGKIVRILSVVMALVFLLTGLAFAAYVPGDEINRVTKPRMVVSGTTATCSVTVTAAGKTIDGTLELKQGNTVIASWSGTSNNTLSLSGTATVTSGVTYTLTVSGTINGVAFTPASITKTP